MNNRNTLAVHNIKTNTILPAPLLRVHLSIQQMTEFLQKNTKKMVHVSFSLLEEIWAVTKKNTPYSSKTFLEYELMYEWIVLWIWLQLLAITAAAIARSKATDSNTACVYVWYTDLCQGECTFWFQCLRLVTCCFITRYWGLFPNLVLGSDSVINLGTVRILHGG